MKRWSYGHASMSAAEVDGVPIVRVAGVISSVGAALVLADNAAWVDAVRPLVQVVSYEAAAMAVDADRLYSAAASVADVASGLRLPTALVVPSDQLSMFMRYAVMMRERGIPRMVFTDFERARSWAAHHAMVELSWRLQSPAGRAGP